MFLNTVAHMIKSLPAMVEIQVQSLSPVEEKGYPPQYSCLGYSMDRRARQARVYGVLEFDMTERLTQTF